MFAGSLTASVLPRLSQEEIVGESAEYGREE